VQNSGGTAVFSKVSSVVGLPGALPAAQSRTSGPALFDSIPEPLLRAAPVLGADTRQICREVLAMSDSAIDALIETGVLEEQDTPA
jgi:crotonobetainyl-CoA:carnitine CoA-transferase CaiB-like acyl-CoA transferase